jgi:hypothetical protein
MFSSLFNAPLPPHPALIVLLTLVALAALFPLIVITEVIVYQLMRWGRLRECVATAAKVNALTFVVGVAGTLLAPQPALWQLLVFLGLATSLEAFLLQRIRPNAAKANWTVAILANVLSYVVLILPAFQFR